MPQISKGTTFADGQQVTGVRLNDLVDNATLLPGFILDLANITANTLASNDSIAVYDLSAAGLREARISDVLNSGLAITTNSITGVTGGDLIITPATGQKVDIAGGGSFEADNLNITQSVTVGNAITAGGNVTLNTTGFLKLPVGTTLQRPATPAQGHIRFNTSTVKTESYNGTTWSELDNRYDEYDVRAIAVPTFTSWANQTIWESPLITVPADETWIYEVHLVLSGDNNNGNTRPEQVGAVKLQIGTATPVIYRVDHGVYGGPMSAVTSIVTLTSANTPTPQRVRLSSDATIGGSFRNGWNNGSHMKVSLTRRKTANVGNPTTYI